jgi:hypothetical protein
MINTTILSWVTFSFYESLIFFAWTIVLLYLLMEWRLKTAVSAFSFCLSRF